MKTKIIVIGICMLFIATMIPVVSSLNDGAVTPKNVSTFDTWTEIQKLLASDGETNDEFGLSVSIDGDTALIGTVKDNENGQYAGSAYVFIRTDDTWTFQQKLLAINGQAHDYFGYSVSLSGDTALIGAVGVDSGKGASYVFVRSGVTWAEQAKLTASDAGLYDEFGCSVSVNQDTSLIGSYGHEGGKGSAYVFVRTGATWTQQAELLASDGNTNDQFGLSVALDGDSALIGAHWDDFSDDDDAGSAYVFTRAGTTWTQQQKLVASDGQAGDEFGRSVSLSGDTALIGAPKNDMASTPGSAYVFARSDTVWAQQQKLVPSDGVAPDYFGCAVALDDDTAVIGAFWGDGLVTDSGSAYVFARSGTLWSEQAKLFASDGEGYDEFGYAVSLWEDTALVGAFQDDGAKGSAYVFTSEVDNQPPSAPVISGPASGKAKHMYNYSFNSTDPNNDDVSYFIDWGDNTTSGWIGPYASGTAIIQSHAWSKKGTYTITAKARDVYGTESGWGTFAVSMPLSLVFPQVWFFTWLFERFPQAFPLLRHLLWA